MITRLLRAAGGVAAGVLVVGCGAEDDCAVSPRSLSLAKKSSLGFSLEQAIEGRTGQGGTLTWSATPDWLSYSADTEPQIVSIATYDSAKVTEEGSLEDECEAVVVSTLNVELATTDGQIRAKGEAEVTATKKNSYSLHAVFAGEDLSGAFSIGSNGRLVVNYTVSGNDVTGSIMAAASEADDMTGRVRQATIARWEGSVGEMTLPAVDDGTLPPLIEE